MPAGGPRGRRRRALFGDVGVDLGRPQARVAEQLLDDPQVGATVEQMGGVAVAQRVRMRRHRRAAVEDAADVARAERVAALR